MKIKANKTFKNGGIARARKGQVSLISIAAAAVTHVLIVTLFIHIFVIISIFNLHLQKKNRTRFISVQSTFNSP